MNEMPTSDLLPFPDSQLNHIDMLVQEKIHGHRFIPEQEPFMILLETLALCAQVSLGKYKAEPGKHESFEYDLPHRRKMRFLLFTDRHLESVKENERIADTEKWDRWKECINREFGHSVSNEDHFQYLDRHFGNDFRSLIQSVRLIRSQEMDVMHNRRWTSRFLSVTGPDMICTDMRASANKEWSPDRRFFGRGGEIIFLMLNRSEDAARIQKKVKERLLNSETPINKIASALCDPEGDRKSTTSIGYLPLIKHKAYERVAKDWLAILEQKKLPDGHLFEPLVRITGLNLLVYLAERASEVTDNNIEPILADLTNGRDRQLRNSSKEHFNRHRQVAHRAVTAYIKKEVSNNGRWQIAESQGDSVIAKQVIQRIFKCEIDAGPSPEETLDAFIQRANSRDKNNAHKFLLPLARHSGLATSRPGVGTWFAIDDAMICALVMANVGNTMELREFVAKLYDRYQLVIGPEEARTAFTRLPVGIQSFEDNLAALESRMTRLAFTQRLSDDCAFVNNPYQNHNE